METVDENKPYNIRIAQDYILRSYYEGIKTNEIPEIKNILKEINYISECEEKEQLKKILDDLYRLNIINNFNYVKDTYDFIDKNTLLSGLVFANNRSTKIRKKDNFESLFLCQFHGDKRPSLLVTPQTNSFFCHKCQAKGNAISYIAAKEQISTSAAISLVSAIFLLNYPNQKYDVDKKLLHHYQYSIVSDEFYNYILELENKFYENEDNYSMLEKEMIEMAINRAYYIIDRLKKGKYEAYKENDGRKLSLIYELPNNTEK